MSAIEQFQGQSLMAQAEMLSKSGIVPKAFRGKPADVLAACLWGAEIGLGAMASMSYIDLIEGTPTINAEGCNALVRRAGHSLVVKATPTEATATGKRRDTGDAMTVTWTIQMAQRAGLATKQVWKSYPEAMLTARAVTQLCRSLFPDVLAGISYAPEEAASFAAPAMLDDEPEALAARTNGHAALPPANVDAETGEITTVAEAAQAQGKTSRRFAPPSTSAANTKRIMGDLAAADQVKALKARIAELDAFAKDELTDAWKAGGLPSVAGSGATLTADQLVEATALVDAAEAGT